MKNIDLARGLDVDPSLITRWRRRGMPIYSIDAASSWRAQNIRPRFKLASHEKAPRVLTEQPGPMGTATTLQEARRRREVAEAQLAERNLAVLEGRLLDRAIVDRVARGYAAVVVSGWDQFVVRVGAELGPDARPVLRREADRARREIVAALESWQASPDGGELRAAQ